MADGVQPGTEAAAASMQTTFLQLAVSLRLYFDALIAEGFTEAQAIVLTEAFQRDMIPRGKS